MITSALAEGNTEIILCWILLSVKSLFEKAITPGMSSIPCKKGEQNKIHFHQSKRSRILWDAVDFTASVPLLPLGVGITGP